MRKLTVLAVCVASAGLWSGCSMNLGNDRWGVQSVPNGAWSVAVVKAEDGTRSIETSLDSLATGSAILDVAKGLFDDGTGIPVMGSIKVVGNLIQSFLDTIDPKAKAEDG